MKIIQSPSSNFSDSSYEKVGVQIHKTLGRMPGALSWLRNPWSFVSAHYFITRKGDVHQLVKLNKRAWSSGRINQPSERAKRVMLKNRFGRYVKPGHYLVQIEFECLENETFTSEQYFQGKALMQKFDFDITEKNFLTHKDTAIDKPDLEEERAEFLKRLKDTGDECDSKPLVLNKWSELRIDLRDDGKIVLSSILQA